MTLDYSQKITAIRLLLEKSDKNMEQAIRIADMDYWDLVANRLYYAVFHAVNAMLMIDNIKTVTHKGTSVQFGKFYILTGKFSRQDGTLYGQLQTMREKADYQNVFSLEKEERVLQNPKLLNCRDMPSACIGCLSIIRAKGTSLQFRSSATPSRS